MKTITILGIDGYIGWTLALDLLNKGYKVAGLDNFCRRDRVRSFGSDSLTPISDIKKRSDILESYPNFIDRIAVLDMTDTPLFNFIEFIQPDVIIHLAEQPSAPWSMKSPGHAYATQRDNVLGTLNLLWAIKQHCPEAHLIKLGTMGEYGTPECDIPEGRIPRECITGPAEKGEPIKHCHMADLLFPRTAGSFYHLSKVHDTYNIEFACRNWGLSSTDIMQGVVFGLNEPADPTLFTRFDYDEYFGTAINRFCAQALIEHPLTVYGKGNQTRGFLPLKDSIQCLNIAIENPPSPGEYRTFNQFENIYSINSLAEMVKASATELGLNVDIAHISNPRKEAEEHYYNPTHQKLFDLGYVPTTDIQSEITKLITQLKPFTKRIKPSVILPKTLW